MTSEEMEAGLLLLAETVQALSVSMLALVKVLNEKGVTTEQELNEAAGAILQDAQRE